MGNFGFQDIVGFLVPLIIFVFLGTLLADWFFEIKKRNRYMEAQIRLLMHIAASQRVDPDKISEIVAEAKLPERRG